MKKITFLLFLALGLSCANAKTVTSEQAQATAQRFLLSQSELALKRAHEVSTGLREVYRATSSISATPLYYIFNREDAPGFVVVSGDDRAPEVLGYSTESNFDAGNIPANVEWWLSQYAGQIEHAITTDEVVSSSQERMKAQSNWTSIAPLVKTSWSQNAPYNILCPTNADGNFPTGCVATMMAQVMKYYEWPPQGMGYNEYNWNGQTLSMDFSTVTFDWDNMPFGEPSTAQQKEAVAKLMQACGYSVDMNYISGGSTASSYTASRAFCDYFKYEAEYLERDDYEGDWDALIYNELKNGRPVCYSGQGSDGGHAFICDGYAPTGMFHINWGWGSSADGYFRLTPFDSSYKEWQSIIYGIRPVNLAKIDGVWYSISSDGASVKAPIDHIPYEGDLVIPANIMYEGKSYPVTKLYSDVLKNCKNLTSLVIEAPIIEEIDDALFYGSESLTKVSLPSSVKSIGFGAFQDCPALREVNLGTNVEIIDSQAFQNCSSLQHIEAGNKLREIGHLAFMQCTSLQDFNLPTTIEKIGSSAFYQAPCFTDLVLGDALVELGSAAFAESSNLRSVKIGKSLKIIPDRAFNSCEELSNISLETAAIEEIGSNAFAYCHKLTELELPSSLRTIGEAAFFDDQGLTKVTFGDHLETIGSNAFYHCDKLSEVVLPNSVKHIDDEAFSYTNSLSYVRLGGNVEWLGREAFYRYDSVDRVDCYALEPPIYGNKAFYITMYLGIPVLHVCKGLADVYRTASGWGNFGYIIDDLNAEEGGTEEIFVDNHPETNNVYSITGALIKANATEADLQTLPSGIYIFGNRKIVK